jgi:hypothetical protein
VGQSVCPFLYLFFSTSGPLGGQEQEVDEALRVGLMLVPDNFEVDPGFVDFESSTFPLGQLQGIHVPEF